MKTQNKIIALAFFIISFNAFSQEIGTGFPAQITDFSVALKSGVYNGLNAAGRTPDDSYSGWQHLFVTRHTNSTYNFQLQIASSFTKNDRLFFRKIENNVVGSENNGWVELATRGANTFTGNQTINGRIFASTASAEGGALSLVNPSKTGNGMANEWILYNMTGGYGNSLQFWNYGTGIGGPKLTILDGGNIGIGTQTPSAKLEVFGGSATSTNLILSANYKDAFRWRFNTLDRGNAIDLDFTASDNLDDQEQVLKLSRSTSGRPEFQLYNNAIVANDGNVGIGTAAPDAKLTVNGTIHTKEVLIDLAGAFAVPDYVFANNYKLKSLTEVDNYIQAYNHLPEIPSATEMAKNGMQVSEMNLSLLKKIEELTLYLIEQNKQIEILKTEVKELKK